jgi:two-component system chemotaxis sensor kinase CheA
MSLDLSQFIGTFIEESNEGLSLMESGLLSLKDGAADPDTVNAIFRAAHSIKGGAGTFGFMAVSQFTHSVETLLDAMRRGERAVTPGVVDALLASVDMIHALLDAAQSGAAVDEAARDTLGARLKTLITAPASSATAPASSATAQADTACATPASAAASVVTGWRILFRPQPHLLQSGNEPVRILRALAELGTLTVHAECAQLPALAELDPECAYLGWTIELAGNVAEAAVREIFEWVEGDCELEIAALVKDGAGGQGPGPVLSTVEGAGEATAVPPLPPAGEGRGEGADVVHPAAAATTAPPAVPRPPAAESGSIRVGIDKIDALMNIAGELVITQSMLGQLGADLDGLPGERQEQLRLGFALLERHTRELQESVMRVRMLPISFAFSRYPRVVRDLAAKLGKQVNLKLSGEQTEIDKTVMEKIGDPLTHLVRNTLDHGIETPEQRRAAGKSEAGTLTLSADQKGGNIVIEVSDDGAGLNVARILAKARERGLVGPDEQPTDERILELIFEPGFSTAEQVSDVSGRGVGMDVVRRNIKALGGAVEVRSVPGQGATFTIRLPLTLAILDGQLLRVAGQTFIAPLVSIVESVQIEAARINAVAGQAQLYRMRDQYIPMLRLDTLFNLRRAARATGLLVVVEVEGQPVGFVVDELLGQQQVVIKSMDENYQRVDGVSGATILGDGTVALILDIPGLHALARRACHAPGLAA